MRTNLSASGSGWPAAAALAVLLTVFGARDVGGQDVDPTSDRNVQPTGVTAPAGYRYRLAFSDEFNGSAVDETKWNYRLGTKSVSAMLAHNNRVSDGLYRIDLKKETVNGKPYTCGGIISKKYVRYGYYEASLKIPPGAGWHTSFWMMDINSTSPLLELDPFENDSIHPTNYTVDAHQWKDTGTGKQIRLGTDTINTADLSKTFRVIGLSFTTNALTYYHDGQLVHTYDATKIAHQDVNIWLTCLGFTNTWNTPAVDDARLPLEAQFEYVRFFEQVSSQGQPEE